MTKEKVIQSLSPHDMRELRNQLHHLKPVVIIGNNGLTDAVIQEIDHALTDHELIKVRAHIENSEELTKVAEKITKKTNSTLIQTIGHIVAVYRKNLYVEE